MFVIKVGAYLLTGSAAILSDAAESVVHVAAVAFAAYSLKLSYKPADESHLYGHAKIAFFSAGFEGAMIILAAAFIIYESIHKWFTGLHLENLGFGTALTAAAANQRRPGHIFCGRAAQKSLILEANGKSMCSRTVGRAWLSWWGLVFHGLAPSIHLRHSHGLQYLFLLRVDGKSAWTGLMDTARRLRRNS
jgi:cation diffusion facilitator family transporter